MKIIKLLSVCFFLFTITSSVFAQRRAPSQEEMEKFRAKKISFLTEQLQLTPQEAQKFWPIYNQAEKEGWDAQMKRGEIERRVQRENGGLTDKQIIELTKEMVETHKAEALIVEKYNKKYLEVLPAQKVLKLYQAEHQFLRQVLRENFNRRSEGTN